MIVFLLKAEGGCSATLGSYSSLPSQMDILLLAARSFDEARLPLRDDLIELLLECRSYLIWLLF
jgi:hypothetical protein